MEPHTSSASPAVNRSKKQAVHSKRIPVISRVTHANKKNEDMTRGRDGAKVNVVVMKGEPSAQGQTMKPTSL